MDRTRSVKCHPCEHCHMSPLKPLSQHLINHHPIQQHLFYRHQPPGMARCHDTSPHTPKAVHRRNTCRCTSLLPALHPTSTGCQSRASTAGPPGTLASQPASHPSQQLAATASEPCKWHRALSCVS